MNSIKLSSALLFSTAMMTGLFGSVAVAADVDPGCVQAVSSVNGKLEGSGGYFDSDAATDETRFLGVATLSMPLGCDFGLQFDGGFGQVGNDEYFGVGGHVFMRDPSSHLLGIHAQYFDFEGEDLVRLGAEAEIYLDQVTFSAVAGWEDINNLNTNAIYGGIEGGLYLTDDIRISAGYRHFMETDVGTFGFEMQPSTMPASLFAEAMVGTDDYVAVSGGIRFYFGAGQKSLKARHREDDPAHLMQWVRELQQATVVVTTVGTTGGSTPPPTSTPI